MSIRSIAILGAGHGGYAAAADLTRRGFEVRLQARNPERLAPIRAAGGIEVHGVHEGFVKLDATTTSVAEAIEGADLVMLPVPGTAFADYAMELARVHEPEIPIFLDPGHTGGGLHFLHELRAAGYSKPVKTCESVTLTYICRMEEKGTVNIYSYVKEVAFAALPGRHAAELYDLMKPVYPELTPARNVLETAFANLNAVFHPPGMLMNTGWIEHTQGGFLFYREGMTEGVGRVAEEVDAERIAVAQALGLEVPTFLEAFYRKGITSKAGFKSGSISRACFESEPNRKIKCPPSLDHRYIHEDVGFGLVPFAAFGQLAGVKTPTIDALITL
ncbi:MAG: NAD/NADP octopine/nopaline dehydrogenase family protein, partial [Hyphomicrobiales bacterium]